MKPRIFINMHYMELGGAERALLGLLHAIDTDRVDVDLFLNQHTGAFMSLIPKNINLLPEEPTYSVIEKPLTECIRHRQWKIAYARLVAKYKYNRYLRLNHLTTDGSATHYVFNEVIRFLPSLHKYGHYDLAISFLDPPHIVQEKVDACKKIEWIHTDFSFVKVDVPTTEYWWAKNDYIAAITESVGTQFIKTYPALKDKIIEIHNILSPTIVRAQADAFVVTKPQDIIALCSVGRICEAKNYECIPSVARLLKEKGLHFIWTIVGPGDHQAIDAEAKKLGVDDCIQFIGAKENPYPYIKACDIYVQPSRFEGNSVTVREAQILYRPVIVTNYPTAKDQINHGIDGIICELNNKDIADAIHDLSSHTNKREQLSSYLQEHNYGNENEVEKIYELIGI